MNNRGANNRNSWGGGHNPGNQYSNNNRNHQNPGNQQYNNHNRNNNWGGQRQQNHNPQWNNNNSNNKRSRYTENDPTPFSSKPPVHEYKKTSDSTNASLKLVHNTKPVLPSKEEWKTLSFKQQLLALHPDGLDYKNEDLYKNHFSFIDEGRLTAKEWMDKKIDSASKALSVLKEEERKRKMEEEGDDDESNSSCFSEDSIITNGPTDVEEYIKNLPYNVIFHLGFDALGLAPGDEDICYCPCSKKQKPWRCIFLNGNVEANDDRDVADISKIDKCENKGKMSPNALMCHLETIAGNEEGRIHRGVFLYLQNLYSNYWKEGLGHKGIYKMGDANWKAAEAADINKKYRDHQHIMKELNEERLKNQEEMKKYKELEERLECLKKNNKDMFDKYKQMKDIYSKLNMDMKVKIVSEEEKQRIEMSKNILRIYFESIRNAIQAAFPSTKQANVNILKVPNGNGEIVIQDIFDQWYVDKPKNLLFMEWDEGKTNSSDRIFLKWNVMFEFNLVGLKKKGDKKDMTWVDAGGPTAIFLSEFFSQVGRLAVKVEDPVSNKMISFNLFNTSRKVLELATDDTFMNVRKANKLPNKTYKEAMKQVRSYYRAIGRIIMSCIIHQMNPIPYSLFPSFYRNVLLRKQKPGVNYDKHDLLRHVMDELEYESLDPNKLIGSELKLIYPDDEDIDAIEIDDDDDDDVVKAKNNNNSIESDKFQYYDDNVDDDVTIDDENIFSKVIPLVLLKHRSIAIKALDEGLGTHSNIRQFLPEIPLAALNETVFCPDSIDADDLIHFIRRSEESDDGGGDDDFNESVAQCQEMFLRETLPAVIRNGDDAFRRDFLEVVTGKKYLPHKSDPLFKIEILFERAKDNDHLPSCWTCVNLLSVSMYAYNNDAEVLRSKLDKLIKETKGVFGGMN